jgi:hypothetical protein
MRVRKERGRESDILRAAGGGEGHRHETPLFYNSNDIVVIEIQYQYQSVYQFVSSSVVGILHPPSPANTIIIHHVSQQLL